MKAFFAALLLLTSISAHAEEPSPASAASGFSFSSIEWGRMLEKIGANYSALFLGPTLQKLNGDTQGKGHYISMRNYFSFDAELARDLEVQTGWELRQTWRPADPKNPNRRDLDGRDPYVAISRRNLIQAGNFSLGTKARYFIPVSEYNKSKIGKIDDAGRGELNVGISPYMRFLDGDLGVSCSFDFYYKFDKQAAANRENYAVRAKPLVTYRFTRKFAGKVEYNTGPIRHTNNGRWSKLNDKFNGQKLYAGVTYYPTSTLSFNPSLGWGSDTFRLNRAEVSLFASYNFL